MVGTYRETQQGMLPEFCVCAAPDPHRIRLVALTAKLPKAIRRSGTVELDPSRRTMRTNTASSARTPLVLTILALCLLLILALSV